MCLLFYGKNHKNFLANTTLIISYEMGNRVLFQLSNSLKKIDIQEFWLLYDHLILEIQTYSILKDRKVKWNFLVILVYLVFFLY